MTPTSSAWVQLLLDVGQSTNRLSVPAHRRYCLRITPFPWPKWAASLGVASSVLRYFLKSGYIISECANVRVQFKGRNNTTADAINIATFTHSYAHCSPIRFSQNEHEICMWSLDINRPIPAVLYSWVIVDDDFNKFNCTFRCYSCNQTIELWATPTKIITHVHRVGTIQGWGLFHSAIARWPVREEFKDIQYRV